MPGKEQDLDLTNLKAELLNAAMSAGKNPNLWLSIGEYLYKKITENSPLGSEDLTKYRAMCLLYTVCTKSEPPKQWALDDKNRPTYSSEFAAQDAALRHELASFNDCQHSLKTQILGIVANISRLFESLSKRKNYFGRDVYRPDGVESMFLNELAMWLVIELPRYKITDIKTADMVKRRIDYCQAMQDRVLVFREDHDIANPKNILPSVIAELKIMHQHLVEAHCAASFSDKIKLIDESILEMVRDTFNILHLMLKEVDQREFQVLEFLKPGEGRKKKNDIFKKTLLGQWIVQTCEVAGISSNNFLNTKAIPLAVVDHHISIDPTTLKDIDQIGFCDFVWRKNYQMVSGPSVSKEASTYLNTKAPVFLGLIIDLHRSILRLSYIRQGLMIGLQLNIAYGEAWLFAKKEGKPLFDGLMDSLSHAINRHMDALNKFWKEFYTNTYEPFAKVQHKDSSDKTYCDMLTAHDFYEKSQQKETNIKALVGNIHHRSYQVQSEVESNKEKRDMLTRQLYSYLSKIPGYDSAKLAALSVLMETTSHSKAATENTVRKAWLATVTLTQHGGYRPEDIPPELLDDVGQYLMLPPDTPERELEAHKAKYEAALAVARAHKRTKKEGAAMPTTETSSTAVTGTNLSTGLVYTKDSMKTAILLKEAFELSIDKYSKFVPLSTITPQVHRLEGIHLLIYQNVLKAYSGIAENYLISLVNGYSTKERELLRKHYSRMTSALVVVANTLDLYKPGNEVQLDLVNRYLIQGLHDMFKDMPSMIKYCATVIVAIAPPKEKLLEELPGGRVRVISPEVAVATAKAESAKDKAEATAAKAATVVAKADSARDRSAAEKAIAAAERATAAMAATEKAMAELRADFAKDRAAMLAVLQTYSPMAPIEKAAVSQNSPGAGELGLFATVDARDAGKSLPKTQSVATIA